MKKFHQKIKRSVWKQWNLVSAPTQTRGEVRADEDGKHWECVSGSRYLRWVRRSISTEAKSQS